LNEATERSRRELNEKLANTQTLLLADINKTEGYNRALREFIVYYKETSSEQQSKALAEAVKTVKTAEIRKRARKEVDSQVEKLLSRAKETAEVRGVLKGTFKTAEMVAMHGTNEPPMLLDDGTRNPSHLVTLGCDSAHKLGRHEDLMGIGARPRIESGADYGFWNGVVEAIKEFMENE
jgi:mRNA-degrading endonuclease toxin of MazEF toxin-antitoxin module